MALDPDPEKRNRISRLVSEKHRYVPRKSGGLELRHFQHSLNISTVNSAIRYLNNEGPEDTNKIFRQAVLSAEEYLVHWLFCNACHSLNLRFNSLNYEQSTPPRLMNHHENVYVRFSTYTTNRVTKWGNKQRPPTTDLGIYRGRVVDTSDDRASVYFPGDDTNFTLRASQKVYTLHPPVISVPLNILGTHHLLIRQYHTCPPLRDNSPPPPSGHPS